MTWAMFRRALDKGSRWEFCGFTEHDERVTEFEEASESEYTTAVIALED
jgi:hypothetical protein